MNAGLWNEASHAFVGDANIINSETKAVTLLSASQLMLNAHLPTGSRQLALSPTAD